MYSSDATYVLNYLTDVVDARGDDKLLDGLQSYEMLKPANKDVVKRYLMDMYYGGALEEINDVRLEQAVDEIFDTKLSTRIMRMLYDAVSEKNAMAPDHIVNEQLAELLAFRDIDIDKQEKIQNAIFELVSELVEWPGKYM